MAKHAPYARIAITLPPEDLDAADRLASQWDRSRSWIIAEAVRRMVAAERSTPELHEQRPQQSSLGESRLSQLRRDLALTPEQRVLLAEETLGNVPSATEAPLGSRFFDHYDDFLDWKRYRTRTP